MTNLIKSEFYRMIKSKSTYVILIIFSLLTLVNPLTFKAVFSAKSGHSGAISDGTSVYNTTILNFVEENLSGGVLLLMAVIFMVIYYNAEINHGYIKSILSYVGRRKNLAIANFIVAEITLLAMFILNVAVTSIGSIILLNDIKFGDFSEFLPWCLIQFLFHSAINALMMLLTYLTRSTALSMTVGICIASGIPNLIYTLITMLGIRYLNFPDTFSLSDYSVSQNIMSLELDASGNELIRPILVGVITLASAFILSCIVIKKKDIR